MSSISPLRPWLVLAAALALVLPWAARAQQTAGSGRTEQTGGAPGSEAAAWAAASAAILPGPQQVALRDQAELALPEGYGFVPQQEGAVLLELMGNEAGEHFVGMVVPLSDADWFVSVDYEPSGYVRDDDARDWDASELLESLKRGTEAGNARRQQLGVDPIEVTRWIEAPAYDPELHHLVWSAEARTRGAPGGDPTVNYNTYVLGREGYISLNLVTAASKVEFHRPAAQQLLGAVQFREGKRYAEFAAGTDKVAAYGLAALVDGIAPQKAGGLAAATAHLARFGLLLALAAAAGAGVWFAVRLRTRAATNRTAA